MSTTEVFLVPRSLRSVGRDFVCLVLASILLFSILTGTTTAAESSRGMPTTGQTNPVIRDYLASSSTTNFSSLTPQLLAQLNGSDTGFDPAPISSLSNTFTMDSGILPNGGEGWDLGDGVWLNVSGITNFSSAVDPDYPHIAALLADGMNESLAFQERTPVGRGGGVAAFESLWFNRHPDFVGYQIDFIRLNEYDLSLTPSQGGTQIYENHSWEIWGHRLFVAFYPPTDPDGAYLVDRNDTLVNVSLAEPGTATLNWDGANWSMIGNGTAWSLAVSALPNGVHTYEVYAQNATGGVFSTEFRRLTVGRGIWARIPFGYGLLPSMMYDAAGRLHACFGGDSLTYAVLDSGTWNRTNVSAVSGYLYCSLALDASGHPEIAYSSGTGLFLAAYNGIAWSSIEASPTPNTVPSLAIDPITNHPWIAYGDLPSVGLVLESYDNGTWTTQVVASGYTGFNPSLTIDSQGQPHIAYNDPNSGELRYATRNGTGWSSVILDTKLPGATQGVLSMRLAANDQPHIGYLTSTGLKHATVNGTIWTNETVDVKTFHFVSLSVDLQGRPHIAYARSGGDLRYAEWNGTWSIQVVSHGAGSNGYVDVGTAISPDGEPALLYQGNVSFGNLVFATNRDMAPPSTMASLAGSGGVDRWYRSSVRVTLIATDDLLVLNSSYRIDGGPWLEYFGPFIVSGDGNHMIQFFSIDTAGFVEPVQSTEFGIDTNAPTIQAQASGILGSSGWYISDVRVTLTANDTGSGIASVRYRLDGGLWQNYTAPFLIRTDGAHAFTYTATDFAGNQATMGTLNFEIDTRAPASSLSIDETPRTTGWYVARPTVHLTATDATSGVASLLYAIDGGRWQTYFTPFVLGDGPHTVEYRATDRAGNVEATRSIVIKVDTVAPTLTNLTPSGPLTSGSVTVSWSGHDNVSGVTGYTVRVDGGANHDIGLNTSVTLSLPDGPHQIQIEAFDAAGNSANQTTGITIDTNVFSPSGPYKGIPTYILTGLTVGGATLFLLRTWRRRKPPTLP